MSTRFSRFVAGILLGTAVVFATGQAIGQEKSSQPHSQGAPAPKASSQAMSPADRKAIEDIVREFILKNPEIIVEAVQNLQDREKQDSNQRVKANLVAKRTELLNDPDTPAGGNPKGDVTIVEFFDYRCGYCKRVMPALQEVLRTDKNVRFVFKEFPILGPESVAASKVALAAWLVDKEKYEALHWALMKATGALPESRLMKVATDAGFDAKALKKAMDDPKIDELIRRNYALAEALEINGTPAFIIGDHVIRGATDLDAFRQLIARARGS
jgi:protein-disulfide isomerase